MAVLVYDFLTIALESGILVVEGDGSLQGPVLDVNIWVWAHVALDELALDFLPSLSVLLVLLLLGVL
jgi:hypothetical protein